MNSRLQRSTSYCKAKLLLCPSLRMRVGRPSRAEELPMLCCRGAPPSWFATSGATPKALRSRSEGRPSRHGDEPQHVGRNDPKCGCCARRARSRPAPICHTARRRCDVDRRCVLWLDYAITSVTRLVARSRSYCGACSRTRAVRAEIRQAPGVVPVQRRNAWTVEASSA